ncbi:hypothetical protein K474DRAFT_1665379 [Panus rudis PR-1116 ss-1]|nr:hypothetical protein K474DRAFT_1665379 [Panus rudis PR-1116 ss-1]
MHDDEHHDDEMRELNHEADYLEQKTTVVPTSVPPPAQKLERSSDPDAQAQVIESLRTQVQDLFSQVSQLNSKLVRSYDRISDLEDELHVTSDNLRQSTLKISALELERTQHLSALNTGLLVEKSHVTSELTRLMEKATEEAAARGQAESARIAIEKELDDLSAGLFDQANRMVAEARLAQARSEQKVHETEEALKGAEEIVGVLQAQMQALQTEKEAAERQVREMQATMGKGKWVARPETTLETKLRLLCTHPPYFEFIQFITHLRTIRPATQHSPAMSTLLPLPFLARLVAEDSDPTVRLDLAPSLNWLTRRSVLSAIHSGQLNIEPMATHTLLEELAPPMISVPSSNTHVVCALCGAIIIEPSHQSSPTTKGLSGAARTGSWSQAILKNSFVHSALSQYSNNSPTPTHPVEPPSQVYIFKLETSSSGLPVSLPKSSQQPNGQPRPTIYPLCPNGWCLTRLRTTCSLWAFIRTSIVEKVWEEEPYVPPPTIETKLTVNGADGSTSPDGRPPVPPPRRSRIGALWGSMQRGLSGTRDGERNAGDGKGSATPPPTPPSRDTRERRLPPPPPSHPPLHAPVPKLAQTNSNAPTSPPSLPARSSTETPTATPPPLPKRSRTRDVNTRPSTPSLPNGTSTPDVQGAAAAPTSETEQKSVEGADDKKLSLPPPELTRSESHDDFTTPVEELPPHQHHSPITPTQNQGSRPSTPSTIPLPASAPGTPTPPPSQAERPSTPVITQTQEDKDKEKTSSSRTGSPAPPPPPLPRRAAARARPTSAVPVASEGTKDAPATAVVEGGEPPKAGVDESQREDEHTKPAGDTSGSEEKPAVSHVQESVTSESVGGEGTAPLTNGVDASVPNPTSAEEKDKAMEKAESAAVPPALPPRRIITDDAETLPVVSEPEPEKVEEEEDERGLYVSDATWEERTYKELVKLREDMFWARLGGIR